MEADPVERGGHVGSNPLSVAMNSFTGEEGREEEIGGREGTGREGVDEPHPFKIPGSAPV